MVVKAQDSGVSDQLRQFGARVRELRSKIGWSQERLAQECRLDRSYIGGVERGERNVSLINIHKIAKALVVPPSRLLETADERAAR